MVSRIEVGWRQGEKEGTIPVDVVYSKRRTIGLEVQADGKVLIRVPKGITKKALMDFVNERQEWIVEKWFLVETRRQRKAARPKADYEENPEVEAFYRRAARKRLLSEPPGMQRLWESPMEESASVLQKPAGAAAAEKEI